MRLRISLRLTLLLMALALMPVAWLANLRRQGQVQERAVSLLSHRGVAVELRHSPRDDVSIVYGWLPEFVCEAVGEHAIHDVEEVEFCPCPVCESEPRVWPRHITDQDLLPLSDFRSIGYLSLRGTNVSDRGMERIAQLSSLEGLNLAQTKITAEGLALLADLHGLRALGLVETPLTSEGLAIVARLPELRWLNLGRTQLAHKDLMLLAKAPKLESLMLYDVELSPETVSALPKLTRLKSLWLSKSSVPNGIIDELRHQMPDCKIEFLRE